MEDMFIAFVSLVLAFQSCVVALLETKYAIHNPQGGENFGICGQLLQESLTCAGRFTNTTCEPLTADWCVTKDMSDGATYMTKKIVTDVLQVTLVGNTNDMYNRKVPINITEGCEIKMKFMMHVGWNSVVMAFRGELGYVILRTQIKPNDFLWKSKINGTWGTSEGHVGTASFTAETEYTLKIVCRTNDFQIFLNEELQWTYIYQLPPESIRLFVAFFTGVPGDLFYVSYKAAP